ncbi:MAG: hypothetical protein HN742_16975 [Lentisphaerae bacterium]|nr:hypothetical protein [Lentisphaerota bacterium]MBT5606855.1 hypothetical protein [Lentisphaerota bacterium]MBT7059002.1 hypothetical protein [Lentisphaerota bacterium]MBT7843574.1 hypothetical protein [Lentisphaerota bacterium]
MHVFIYSHTHWDREWYLSRNQFQFRLIRTVDEIIDVLQAENSFEVFVLDGQTCVLEDYLEIRPERRPLLQELIAAGKLVIGPWYTMPDTFLPDGEALVRNLVRGYADCAGFGADFPNVGYVPDSFGHIEQLPQILRGVGIDNFVFSRGRPVAIASADGHKREFLWSSPDGSTVYAWHLPGGYTAGQFLPGPDEEDELRARFEQQIAAFAPSHRPDIVCVPHGIDHCWLQRDIPEILDALPHLLPDVTFHHGSLKDALDAWKNDVPVDMETVEGQLRGCLQINELHGTLSSRIDNKIANEEAQIHIENLAEPLDAMATWFGKPGSGCFLRRAWALICQNHAHDSICGCSQDRVHTDVNQRFREAVELGIDIADSALDFLNNPARRAAVPTLIVYGGLNGGHSVVDFVVRLAERPTGEGCFTDASGRVCPIQFDTVTHMLVRHTNGEQTHYECRGCTRLPPLRPGEIRKLTFSAGTPAPMDVCPGVRCTPTSLENDRIRVLVNADGTLDLEHILTGNVVRRTHYLVQEGDIGGGYHFEPVEGDERRDNRHEGAVSTLVSAGALRGVIDVVSRLEVPLAYDRANGERVGHTTVSVTSRLTLEWGSDTLKIATTVQNTAENQRIRLVLPTGMVTTTVAADASFAVHQNSPERWAADDRQNSHPMRNFVDISDEDVGVAFIGKGLHEYEIVSTPDGTELEVTLLRSVDFVLLCSTWETPEAQLKRELRFEYALKLHEGDWRSGAVPEAAATFRYAPIAEVHGDYGWEKEHEAHATIGYYALPREGGEVPVDTNRSSWKSINAARDGWRRVEQDRFVEVQMPDRLVPFELEGECLVVSAFKRAEDGDGDVLRFWNYADAPQTVQVTAAKTSASLTQVDLLERPLDESPPHVGTATVSVRPFEIVTVRICG